MGGEGQADLRYQVVADSELGPLELRVSELMAEGWVPIGGFYVHRHEWKNERKGYSESSTTYYQPMVKETP